MKRFIGILFLVGLLALCPQAALGAITAGTPTYGTVVVDATGNQNDNTFMVGMYWVCDATGRVTVDVTGFTKAMYLTGAEFAGITTPTAAYDVVINTKYTSPAVNGGDILRGEGANLANTTDQVGLNYQPALMWCPTLTFTITNAGASKSGYIFLLFRAAGYKQ